MVQAQDYDLTAPGSETPAPPPNGCIALLQNVLIFDGRSTALSAPSSVLVRGNIIERVAANPISVDADSDATVVKGNRRVLMPGLIGADNRELMGITGFINPYPGRLGVVQEGAFADLLLVDGNPLENIKPIEDPGKNFLVIMKDGKIYKNTVPR
jgi:imidazolonepropionase-like amidohydrolase